MSCSSTDVVLIELVQKHKCLFDYLTPEYKKKDYVDDVWKQVAAAIDCTVQESKDKWRNIRAAYVRSLKRNTRPYYLAPLMEFLKPYIRKPDGNRTYPDDDHTADDTETANNEYEEHTFENADFNDTESSDSGEEPPTVQVKLEPDPIASYSDHDYEPQSKLAKYIRQKRLPQKKLKVLNKNSKIDMGTRNDESKRVDNKDAMRYFLLSLLPEFDTMDDSQTRDFKIRVLTLIDEIKGNQSYE